LLYEVSRAGKDKDTSRDTNARDKEKESPSQGTFCVFLFLLYFVFSDIFVLSLLPFLSFSATASIPGGTMSFLGPLGNLQVPFSKLNILFLFADQSKLTLFELCSD
jgi:hypothetical protein